MSYRNCPDTSSEALLDIWPTGVTANTITTNFQVYPNPTKGLFTIDAGDYDMDGIMNVVDMNGRKVYEGNLKTKGGIQSFNPNLSPGLYFIHIIDQHKQLPLVTKLSIY